MLNSRATVVTVLALDVRHERLLELLDGVIYHPVVIVVTSAAGSLAELVLDVVVKGLDNLLVGAKKEVSVAFDIGRSGRGFLLLRSWW